MVSECFDDGAFFLERGGGVGLLQDFGILDMNGIRAGKNTTTVYFGRPVSFGLAPNRWV